METSLTASGDSFPVGTVLITGGAGIVGSHVTQAFLKANPKPAKIVATYHSREVNQFACPGVEYHVCDITSAAEVSKLLDEVRPQVIIHTVSPTPLASASLQHTVNYEATKQLVELAKKHATVQAFVYTSSIFAVELPTTPHHVPLTEENAKTNTLESPRSTTNAYGSTKGAADAFVLAANTGRVFPHIDPDEPQWSAGQLLTCTLRIGGLYGERDPKTIGKTLELVNTSGTRVQFGNDEAVNDWTYTENAAMAHVLAAQRLMRPIYATGDPALKVDGEAFFIADGKPMSFWGFFHRVWKQAGDRHHASEHPSMFKIPFGLAIPMVQALETVFGILWPNRNEFALNSHYLKFIRAGCRVDISKARARLGYEPRCGTEEGIRRSVEWFMNIKKNQ